YTVVMTTSGVLTVEPIYYDAAYWAGRAGYGPTATFAYDDEVGGQYYLFIEPLSGHLTDANYLPWLAGSADQFSSLTIKSQYNDLGLVIPALADYQNYYILEPTNSNSPLGDPWVLGFGIGDQYSSVIPTP
ncbi:MAG: hypothetical protein RRA35_01235, partial [Desulfomonilia bacterium]|nr:hypothetical protein [Desulfomonilia bacterium]